MLRLFFSIVVFSSLVVPAATGGERLIVFAAASMTDAMKEVAPAFMAEDGVDTVLSFAASSVLARQVAAGAPADVFISANRDWVNWLSDREIIQPDDIVAVAGNSLAIVSSETGQSRADPAVILTEGRFAMGDPSHVPAGRYAKAALTDLGLWDKVRDNAVFTENVRVALELARREELAAAIVYASDLVAADGLEKLYTFPPESHPPILYFAAAISDKPAASELLKFLGSSAGQSILADVGFLPVPDEPIE